MHEHLKEASDAIIRCFQNGGKLLLCGNGGSAADCAHIAGELLKGFLRKRPLSDELMRAIGADWAPELQQGLPAIDLTASCALMTAVLNDQDGKLIFAQQVTAYGKPGDILMGLSTSGNSEDVCRALQVARAMGLKSIGLTGKSGGKMKNLCDILLNVDEEETYRVQEKQLPLYHQLCIRVEEAMFPRE